MEVFFFSLFETPELKGLLLFTLGLIFIVLSLRKSPYIRPIAYSLCLLMGLGLGYTLSQLAQPTEREEVTQYIHQIRKHFEQGKVPKGLRSKLRSAFKRKSSVHSKSRCLQKVKNAPIFTKKMKVQLLKLEHLEKSVFEAQWLTRSIQSCSRRRTCSRLLWTLRVYKDQRTQQWNLRVVHVEPWNAHTLEV